MELKLKAEQTLISHCQPLGIENTEFAAEKFLEGGEN
jgi:hypothetical protein